jgi:hypothetical protein
MGFVIISNDDFAELITTMKNGNSTIKNNIRVINPSNNFDIFFLLIITSQSPFSYCCILVQ